MEEKEYKSPQAINDFIKYYRKQIKFENPYVSEVGLAVKLGRLQNFLLQRLNNNGNNNE